MNDIQKEIKPYSQKVRRRSSAAGFLSICLLLFLYAQLFPSGAASPITFSPQRYLEQRFDSVSLCYEGEEFELFGVRQGDTVLPYAFLKRMGVWVLDYPYKRNETATSFGKDAAYYYGSFSSARRAVGQDGAQYLPKTCGGLSLYLFPVPGQKDVYDFGEGRLLILQAKSRATQQQEPPE